MTTAISAPAPHMITSQIINPYDNTVVGIVKVCDPASIDWLLERARNGAETAKRLPRHRRADILERTAALVAADRDSFSRLITQEAGKTIRQAAKEADRCVNTLKLSADEARRNAGEVVPFDAFPGSEGRQGWYAREPLGIIAAITPYNDPLNLVAHKLGPAIAGGNSIILKPSMLAPLSAVRLVETMIAAGLPEEIVTVATGGDALGQAIVSARDVRMISFTGGFATGEAIARSAGIKKLAMDLGGNAPVIVMDDCSINAAVKACVSGAFWAAGQNCIGTQRILVQSGIYSQFREEFVSSVKKLRTGDPSEATTDMGPMITPSAAERARDIVDAAIAAGANLLCGHQLHGSLYSPTVVEGAPEHCAIWAEEVFAPIVSLQKFSTLSQAITMANSSSYSLHAGIFTRDIETALRAAREVDAGGVMINDSSDYRLDAMPFGGYKYGSMGREGVRFAYEEMTQSKVVCFNRSA